MRYSSPCKNCKERYLGCHSKCDSYISFRTKQDIENHKKWKENFLYTTGERRNKHGKKVNDWKR